MEFKDDELKALASEVAYLSLQFGLLLEAGLVVSSAFDELIEMNCENPKLLYALLRSIDKKCKENNTPFINELFLVAQELRCKPLMKFSVLVLDNKNKGSALSDKLEKECSQLQNERLNIAKAAAKEAETKLCFPLMLLLISLIIVCSAPALMQM